MVYSTCLLDEGQNEEVVSWLVRDKEREHRGFEAFVIPVSLSCGDDRGSSDGGTTTDVDFCK